MSVETNRAAELAESLRAMRRNAVAHWAPHGQVPRYAVTMDQIRLGDLSDAADLIEQMRAGLAEWRSVFGHLGATPDDCGNAINKKRLEMQEEINAWRASRLAAKLLDSVKVGE